jgi:23S rRNA (pseudouridine1915-N3)-methyltransferase
MRLLIAAIGRLKQGPERELFAHYRARAEAQGRGLGFAPVTLTEIAESKAATAPLRMQAEAELLLQKIPDRYYLIALEENGDRLTSEAFTAMLAKVRDSGAPGVAFLIGGADGLGWDASSRADRRLSLGPMTLPHGLARIVLAEQIYRAMTILARHPYHRG